MWRRKMYQISDKLNEEPHQRPIYTTAVFDNSSSFLATITVDSPLDIFDYTTTIHTPPSLIRSLGPTITIIIPWLSSIIPYRTGPNTYRIPIKFL